MLCTSGCRGHCPGAEGAASRGRARVRCAVWPQPSGPVPVRLVDERLTTVSAHQALQRVRREPGAATGRSSTRRPPW